jgi:sigma-B regulation protein RsbU (phosphoserine phosphatase)
LKAQGRDFSFLASAPDLFLAGMEDTVYRRRQVFLKPGDTLFLYTDGVTEAVDSEGRMYGTGRLRAFLDAQAELPVRELLDRLREDIGAFSQGAEAADDMTMLALRLR